MVSNLGKKNQIVNRKRKKEIKQISWKERTGETIGHNINKLSN